MNRWLNRKNKRISLKVGFLWKVTIIKKYKEFYRQDFVQVIN